MKFIVTDEHRKPRSSAAVVVALALLMSGCYKATGGGWIPSLTGGKAHFGFSVMCKTTYQNGVPFANLYDGQLEWQDGLVKLHGNVEPFDFESVPGTRCQDIREALASNGPLQFSGNCSRPQQGGESGVFVAVVEEDSSFCNIGEDFISLTLIGGRYLGYFNEGCVRQGSIQVF